MEKFLKEQLTLIKPSTTELKEIKNEANSVIGDIKKKIKKQKIKADVFVGGSAAKNTLIKKKKYDIDVFVRFDRSYEDAKLTGMLKKLLPANAKRKKGSRDYFSLKKNSIEVEVIPVVKIANSSQARNITDLSYFHVSYVKKQINKRPGLADEIRLAKAFTYFQRCYGAESYINGFSGYALELLVIHYKSFLGFVKAMAKTNKEKPVIDLGKLYKTKKQLEQEMNKSRLYGPMILVDPTFKERNAIAALSAQTCGKFQKACKAYLKKPSSSFFEIEDKHRKLEKKYGDKLETIILTTNKQAGDIAGTKLYKFHKYLEREISKQFDLKEHYFEYNEGLNTGTIFLVIKPKKEIIICGPPTKMKKAAAAFKKKRKKIVIQKGKLCFVQKLKGLTLSKFLADFKKSKSKIMKEMSVKIK
jgi:tRNA nucleotidyltransferase (CCA-adding enzyme)